MLQIFILLNASVSFFFHSSTFNKRRFSLEKCALRVWIRCEIKLFIYFEANIQIISLNPRMFCSREELAIESRVFFDMKNFYI